MDRVPVQFSVGDGKLYIITVDSIKSSTLSWPIH